MIFVTVGTHEQGFNRLIEEIDRLKGENLVHDKIIIQKGYSNYEPKYCEEVHDLMSWEDVQKYNYDADVIITHGGPSSFMDVLALKKIPIVVPRQAKFKEHVNDHQLEFSRELVARGENIIVVEEISELINAINYVKNEKKVEFESNNKEFNNKLIEEVKKLF